MFFENVRGTTDNDLKNCRMECKNPWSWNKSDGEF